MARFRMVSAALMRVGNQLHIRVIARWRVRITPRSVSLLPRTRADSRAWSLAVRPLGLPPSRQLLALVGVLTLKLGRLTVELRRLLVLRGLLKVELGCLRRRCISRGALGIMLAIDRVLFALACASRTFTFAGSLALIHTA